MLDRLCLDIVNHIIDLSPGTAAAFRHIRRDVPWTCGIVRRIAMQRIADAHRTRHRRRRLLCAYSECCRYSVDTIVWFKPRAICRSSPYCRHHIPEDLLSSASVYTIGEGESALWW